MTNKKIEKESEILSEAEAIELFAYLLSSARTQLDEPADYASMRLLTAAEYLRDFVIDRTSAGTKDLLESTVELTTHAQLNTADQDDYRETRDRLCRMLAEFLVNQGGLHEEAS